MKKLIFPLKKKAVQYYIANLLHFSERGRVFRIEEMATPHLFNVAWKNYAMLCIYFHWNDGEGEWHDYEHVRHFDCVYEEGSRCHIVVEAICCVHEIEKRQDLDERYRKRYKRMTKRLRRFTTKTVIPIPSRTKAFTQSTGGVFEQ